MYNKVQGISKPTAFFQVQIPPPGSGSDYLNAESDLLWPWRLGTSYAAGLRDLAWGFIRAGEMMNM